MQTRIAAIQMTSTQDLQQNLQIANNLIEEAVAANSRFVVLPEMFGIMGLDQTDKLAFRESPGDGPMQYFLSEQARRHGIWLVGGTIPLSSSSPDKACAACLVFDDKGQQVGRYDKMHLFDVNLSSTKEVYCESRVIEPGKEVVVIPTPFGRVGLAICYDVRFPELFRRMQEKQVEIIALPAAFTFTTGSAHWDVLVKARAIENLSYVVTACQTGAHPGGRKTYGHSMIINPWGDVKASLPQGIGVVIADVHLDYLHQLRSDFPVLSHRKLGI